MPRFTELPALVAFDFDGTLARQSTDYSSAIVEILLQHVTMALAEIEALARYATTDRELVTACVSAPSQERAYAELVALQTRNVDDLALAPGIVDALESLRQKYTLAVYSGREQATLIASLHYLGLADLFRYIEGDTGVYPGKPDPAALLALAVRAGAPPGNRMYVGDRMTDFAVAHAAGYAFVCAAWRKDRFTTDVLRCTTTSELDAMIAGVLAGDQALEERERRGCNAAP